MNILIAGGGIGGLITAMMLHERGYSVNIFESVPEFRELGVGINILPHAFRYLDELGIGNDVVTAGIPTRELAYFNRHGQLIWSEPRGLLAGYKWPQVSINRGRFHRLLFDTACRRLGQNRVHLNHRLTSFEEKGDRVTAKFSKHGGGENQVQFTGDILIAADGIHSRVRNIFYPDEGLPHYSGLFMWRGVSLGKVYRTEATMAIIGHLTQRFVAYPITEPDADGNAVINWIAHLTIDEMTKREDWNRKGHIADFIGPFEGWRYDWLDIPALCRSAEAIYEFPMVDRDPLTHWSFGRITLLGDAAHPMYPVGSNGASQAIIDAKAICDALADHNDPVKALNAYEIARLPTTAEIVRSNRTLGPEIVMQMAEERAPDGFDNIEHVIPRAELEEIAARYKQMSGFDHKQLSAKDE